MLVLSNLWHRTTEACPSLYSLVSSSGTPHHTKAIAAFIYPPRVIISRHVVFDEQVFPFMTPIASSSRSLDFLVDEDPSLVQFSLRWGHQRLVHFTRVLSNRDLRQWLLHLPQVSSSRPASQRSLRLLEPLSNRFSPPQSLRLPQLLSSRFSPPWSLRLPQPSSSRILGRQPRPAGSDRPPLTQRAGPWGRHPCRTD